MWIHTQEYHQGVIGPENGIYDFTMEVSSTSCPTLARILEEGVVVKELEENEQIECLNSKGEYYQPEFIRTVYSKGARREAHPASINGA